MSSGVNSASTSASHPLSPLTPDEVARAATIVRNSGKISADARFVTIVLLEPDKQEVQAHPVSPVAVRRAEVILRIPGQRATFEAHVSLTSDQVVHWKQLPGMQPSLTPEEFLDCDRVVRGDSDWQSAMLRRGITDFSLATADAWSLGHTAAQPYQDERLVYAITFVRTGSEDNPYARPIENLLVTVDLDRMEVIEVRDGEIVPLPPNAGNYAEDLVARGDNWTVVHSARSLAPIDISQPLGPDFEVDGHHIRWQKWSLRIGFNAREGLLLHDVSYRDNGRDRPILYRASLSEMYTPYGDPGLIHRHKSAFDEGEYSAGFVVNSLALGCDCLGTIRYFDVTVHNQHGEPIVIPQAICMHEEDYGVVWKHTDFRTGKTETRRNRRLVISSFAVLGNYQYGYFWYFYLDGTIEFEVKLTGMISTGAARPGDTPQHGTLVAPGLYGPNHQHYFTMRLDMCVEGNNNSIFEVNSEPDPVDTRNPFGNAWTAQTTPLITEQQAQRQADPTHGRYWLVTNPSVHNKLGQPVGYKLILGSTATPVAAPDSAAAKRAAFVSKNLWATRYHPDELFAAGRFPNQRNGGHGLPEYSADNRNIQDSDLVVWLNFGDHHIVRPEDWPVMPVTTAGFALKPFGFFDGNPALDLPASHGECDTEKCVQQPE